MTIDIKETVEKYHREFRQAATDVARQQLFVAYRTFINQLTPDQQLLAREAAKPYLLEVIAMAEEMEPFLQRAKDMLSRRQEPA